MRRAPYRLAPERAPAREVHFVSWSQRILLSLLGGAAVLASVFSAIGVVAGICAWCFHSVDVPVAFIMAIVSGSPLLLSVPIAAQSFRAVLASFGYRVESHDEGLAIWQRGRERAFIRFCDIDHFDRAQGGGVVGIADRFGVSHPLQCLSETQFLEIAKVVYPKAQDIASEVRAGASLAVRLGEQTSIELSRDGFKWSPARHLGGGILREGGAARWADVEALRINENALSFRIGKGERVRFESTTSDEWWSAAIAVHELWRSRQTICQSLCRA
jgi:hypothetical protein